jgi:hypothetical protein
MAVAITQTVNAEGMIVDCTITGLTAGTSYDVVRLQHRYVGDDPDTGIPEYEREDPDRKALWSSVAHRQNWKVLGTTLKFRDYEAPIRPFRYFIVPTASVGPFEYNWATGVDYPVSRGTLGPIAHINYVLDNKPRGTVLIRSTAQLGHWVQTCIQDLPEIKYTARGTELAVLGSQYPVYVADTREARRGSIVFTTNTLGQYNDLRAIVFPSTGKIQRVVFDSLGEESLLLDNMVVMPLDVQVEQASKSSIDLRFITIEYVEVDPSSAAVQRAGDNDDLVAVANANFSISDTTPKTNQVITLTDASYASDGAQIIKWDWSFERFSGGKSVYGKSYTKGPHKIHFGKKGKHKIKLRVTAQNGSADVVVKTVTVH